MGLGGWIDRWMESGWVDKWLGRQIGEWEHGWQANRLTTELFLPLSVWTLESTGRGVGGGGQGLRGR